VPRHDSIERPAVALIAQMGEFTPEGAAGRIPPDQPATDAKCELLSQNVPGLGGGVS